MGIVAAGLGIDVWQPMTAMCLEWPQTYEKPLQNGHSGVSAKELVEIARIFDLRRNQPCRDNNAALVSDHARYANGNRHRAAAMDIAASTMAQGY